MDGSVDVVRDAGIATVILNHRAKLDALTKTMWGALDAAVNALSVDDGVRCIVVRGAGERAFSPGNDIAEFATGESPGPSGSAHLLTAPYQAFTPATAGSTSAAPTRRTGSA